MESQGPGCWGWEGGLVQPDHRVQGKQAEKLRLHKGAEPAQKALNTPCEGICILFVTGRYDINLLKQGIY